MKCSRRTCVSARWPFALFRLIGRSAVALGRRTSATSKRSASGTITRQSAPAETRAIRTAKRAGARWRTARRRALSLGAERSSAMRPHRASARRPERASDAKLGNARLRARKEERAAGAPADHRSARVAWNSTAAVGCCLSAKAGATWAIVLRRTPAARPQRTSPARAPLALLVGFIRTGAQPCVACGRAENSARPLFSSKTGARAPPTSRQSSRSSPRCSTCRGRVRNCPRGPCS
jgi:hypothetical protein